MRVPNLRMKLMPNKLKEEASAFSYNLLPLYVSYLYPYLYPFILTLYPYLPFILTLYPYLYPFIFYLNNLDLFST